MIAANTISDRQINTTATFKLGVRYRCWFTQGQEIYLVVCGCPPRDFSKFCQSRQYLGRVGRGRTRSGQGTIGYGGKRVPSGKLVSTTLQSAPVKLAFRVERNEWRQATRHRMQFCSHDPHKARRKGWQFRLLEAPLRKLYPPNGVPKCLS